MVAVPEHDVAFFPDPVGRCPARRRCWSQAKAMQVISACRCRPVQDRPSKWPRPSKAVPSTLFELLVSLLAHPARLDGGGQGAQ
jgi:hypothetical protein